jgi:hypothetical protein
VKRLFISAGVVAIVLIGTTAGKSASPSAGGSTDFGSVPLQAGELPTGPNFALYKAACLTCHTSSYVIQTPKSARNYWEIEVRKMVDLYAAPINDENQKLIVDYLMSVRGLPAAGAK